MNPKKPRIKAGKLCASLGHKYPETYKSEGSTRLYRCLFCSHVERVKAFR